MTFLWLAIFCLGPIVGPTVTSAGPQPISGRIIGGTVAQEAEFPFIAAIYTRTSVALYFCAGTLIDKTWILTAGHCVQDAVSFSIQLGSNTLKAPDSNRKTINATSFILHPDFNPETLEHNIGLIQLPDELLFNDFINEISLPSAALPENTDTVTIGWGQTDDDNPGPVNDLNKVEVVTLTNLHCQYTYGSQIKDQMVCALGSFNQGICVGDVGGPLIQYIDNAAVVVGIASFLSGNGCESEDPSGFIRTFEYMDWIQSQIA